MQHLVEPSEAVFGTVFCFGSALPVYPVRHVEDGRLPVKVNPAGLQFDRGEDDPPPSPALIGHRSPVRAGAWTERRFLKSVLSFCFHQNLCGLKFSLSPESLSFFSDICLILLTHHVLFQEGLPLDRRYPKLDVLRPNSSALSVAIL